MSEATNTELEMQYAYALLKYETEWAERLAKAKDESAEAYLREARTISKERETVLSMQGRTLDEMAEAQNDAEMEEAITAEAQKLLVRQEAQRRVAAGEIGELVFLSEEDLMDRPDPEWWVDGLFMKGTVAMLAGMGGLGKSFFMLHISHAIATGREAFLQMPTKQGKVCYVVAEGAGAFGKRIRAWNAHHRTTAPEGSMSYVEEGVNLSNRKSVDRFIESMKVREFDFIVLDTFSQLSAVQNENDSAQIANVLKEAKRIRDAREGSTVVVVHHVNKGRGEVRGASAFRDNVDTLAILAGTPDNFSLSTRVEDYAKQKDGEGKKLEGFKLEDSEHSKVVVWTGQKPTDADWTRVCNYLADGTDKKSSDVQLHVQGSDRTRQRKLKEWTEQGLLLSSGSGRSLSYRLPEIVTGGVS